VDTGNCWFIVLVCAKNPEKTVFQNAKKPFLQSFVFLVPIFDKKTKEI
jgi:hypothetical protein